LSGRNKQKKCQHFDRKSLVNKEIYWIAGNSGQSRILPARATSHTDKPYVLEPSLNYDKATDQN